MIGGCCGTTPEHIRAMRKRCENAELVPVTEKEFTVVSSYGQSVILGEGSKIIGERINPTGKKRFKQALKEHDLDYILREGITQQDQGAHILDVNVGLPDIDEPALMEEVVQELQSVVNIPLQIDTVDEKAMEKALRIYNGKAMVNSVSGKKESMEKVFPLVKKYGGVVIGLTLDEDGIPADADGRVRIAEKIIKTAEKFGIKKKDIVIDALAMTISSEPEGAKVTLETLRRLRDEIGVNTVLGVSNISFGLPCRPIVNAAFYTMAMLNGLSAGIINPSSEDMMKSWYAYHALMNLDNNCEQYIQKYANSVVSTNIMKTSELSETKLKGENDRSRKSSSKMTLQEAIEKGLRDDAGKITTDMIATEAPLDIINEELIPALNHVGDGFEKGTVFLRSDRCHRLGRLCDRLKQQYGHGACESDCHLRTHRIFAYSVRDPQKSGNRLPHRRYFSAGSRSRYLLYVLLFHHERYDAILQLWHGNHQGGRCHRAGNCLRLRSAAELV